MIYVMLNFKHMDILEQYKKQFPEESKPAPKRQPSSEYGFWVRLVIKLSGGRIQDEAKANQALVIAAVEMLVISFFLLFGIPGFKTKIIVPVEHKFELPR